MSQKGSSVISSENPEMKYKKALLEIQKIHNANQILKEQSQNVKKEMESQINELHHRCQHFEEEAELAKKDKLELSKYLEELQDSNSELRKQYNNLEREVGYLNDVLSEQNSELKKINAFKDQKGLYSLIASYEDKEINYKKQISRQQDLLKAVKESVDGLENEVLKEKAEKHQAEDHLTHAKQEIHQYKELNQTLITRNEAIITNIMNRFAENNQKHQQAEHLILDFTKHLQLLKSVRVDAADSQRKLIPADLYELALQEKNKISLELNKIQILYDQSHQKIRQVFEIEENMKNAQFKAEKLAEECNMLKSKLIVLETKDLVDSQLLDDFELKAYEEKVLLNIIHNDPLPTIKNSGEASHFLTMKSYISELKEKLTKVAFERKDYEKKYRSVKEKFVEKAERLLLLEDQHKILKGKVQGYERLTERLQQELERSVQIHEDQITKMRSLTNNIIMKKSQESKITQAFLKSQLELEMEKFQKNEKNHRQQIETLKLELSSERLSRRELEEKINQTSEFLEIYKNKFHEVASRVGEVEELNSGTSDNLIKYEQLYKEEILKNEALLSQRQSLHSKINQVTDELEQVKFTSKAHLKQIESALQVEIKKLKAEILQLSDEKELYCSQLNLLKKDLESDRNHKEKELSQFKQGTLYLVTLQQNFKQERDTNKLLVNQLEQLKIKADKYLVKSQSISLLEQSVASKNDQINDLIRKELGLEQKQKLNEVEIKENRQQIEELKKQNSKMRMKMMESNQEVRQTFDSKDQEAKKFIHHLQEEVATLTADIREERKAHTRVQNQNANHLIQIARLRDYSEQQKKREWSLVEELSRVKSEFEVKIDECERLKCEGKFRSSSQSQLKNELNQVYEKMYKLNQDHSEMRIKLQAFDDQASDIVREVSSLKTHLSEAEQLAAKLNLNLAPTWQDQRDRDTLINLIQKIKRLLKLTEVTATPTAGFGLSHSENEGVGRGADLNSESNWKMNASYSPINSSPFKNYIRNYDSYEIKAD